MKKPHQQDRLKTEQLSDISHLGRYQQAVGTALAQIKAKRVISRIWAHDHTVWKPDPTEITNRLGWLHSPDAMKEQLPQLTTFVDAVRAAGYTDALVLGMGGSSLAPEVFRKTFGVKQGYLDLALLDSTDPSAVLAYAERCEPAHTLFIVSSKSGTTVETLSFFKYFHNRVADALGKGRAGEHFIAITDPESPLVDLAKAYAFRATFLNDPKIGGRYAALSHFGLVPAVLLGVDLAALLDRAMTMVGHCAGCNGPVKEANAGARLGAVLGALARIGRDKLTLITSPPIAAFSAWVEQLIAESTGKEGKGILPVATEPLGSPNVYGDDRLFAYLRLEGDETHDAAVEALIQAGQPVVELQLRDRYDLGGQFFLWEMATAVAGHLLGINPFDQPDVESAKTLARRIVKVHRESGALPEPTPALTTDGIDVYDDIAGSSVQEILASFLALVRSGDYVALQAYLPPTEKINLALQQLCTGLRDRLKLATTVGYGPRFLHSTGQLHKGDAGHGFFIQLTADAARDVPIPDEAGAPASSITFGVLQAAQALGDRQALLAAGRRVIRFHLKSDAIRGLQRLMEALA